MVQKEKPRPLPLGMLSDSNRPDSIDFQPKGEEIVTAEASALQSASDAAGSDPEDLLQTVEEEMERWDLMMARRAMLYYSITTMGARILKKIVLAFLVPLTVVVLVVALVKIIGDTPMEDALTFSFFGRVVLSSLSYIGCIFIIASHYLHPHMWSERRQHMMLSSWPGLVHYMCILYEASDDSGDCQQFVTMLQQASFFMQMTWQVAVAHGVFRYIHYEKAGLEGRYAILRHLLCWGLPILVTGLLGVTSAGAFQDNVASGKVLSPWCGVSGDPSVRGVKAAFVHAPQILGVVAYGYFYFYIANRKPTTTVFQLGDARISTSPHQDLLHASHEKRMLDISREQPPCLFGPRVLLWDLHRTHHT